MKKKLLMMLALGLVLGLCACGNSGNGGNAGAGNEGNQNVQDEGMKEEPKYVTVQITMENLYDYYELEDYKKISTNDFGDLTELYFQKRLVLKEEFKEKVVDGKVSVEICRTPVPGETYKYGDHYFEYNMETEELTKIEQGYESEQVSDTSIVESYSKDYSIFLDETFANRIEMKEENIAKFDMWEYPDPIILRVAGELTLIEE